MACISRTPGRAPTPGQVGQLKLLMAAGAVSRDAAKGPHDLGMGRCHPNIIGALVDRGEAGKRSKSVKGRSWTEYWLTEAGLKLANELAGSGS